MNQVDKTPQSKLTRLMFIHQKESEVRKSIVLTEGLLIITKAALTVVGSMAT